jgi:hypothetical protein
VGGKDRNHVGGDGKVHGGVMRRVKKLTYKIIDRFV